jgi:aminoglycoside phosphotransferase (APT) family kinase protein
MQDQAPHIDERLVERLVASQFPGWMGLRVQGVANQGWDNRTFHLGEQLLVRLPSAEQYASHVEYEHEWLPVLAPHLSLQIPEPIALGHPGQGYPWKWSVYKWIVGETARPERIRSLPEFARNLAKFLRQMHGVNSADGPPAGAHNFYRGGPLATYEEETLAAISTLAGKINVKTAAAIWQAATKTSWTGHPVWVHGDVSLGNLLTEDGRLSAVIDFGQMCIGDPACDLAIAWTLFRGESREAFRSTLTLDDATWNRGRGWALWKALIIAAGLSQTNAFEGRQCWSTIDEVLADHGQPDAAR